MNRLIESYLKKPQLLTELLNIQRTLNKINPYFENPDARGEDFEVKANEIPEDPEELQAIISYFNDKKDKVKRDVEKMGQGRRGRYRELEAKIQALEAELARQNIPVPPPAAAPEPPPEITTPEPEGDTEPQPGPSGDPYEYAIDDGSKAGQPGCWVTRKKAGPGPWLKIKGNSRIGDRWEEIFARLDAEIGGRTDEDKRKCAGGSEPPGDEEPNPRPSGIDCDKLIKLDSWKALRLAVQEHIPAVKKMYTADFSGGYDLDNFNPSERTKLQRFWGFEPDGRYLKGSYTGNVLELLKRIREVEENCDKPGKKPDEFAFTRMIELMDDISSGETNDMFNLNVDKMESGDLKTELEQKGNDVPVACEKLKRDIEGLKSGNLSESTFRRWAKNAKLL